MITTENQTFTASCAVDIQPYGAGARKHAMHQMVEAGRIVGAAMNSKDSRAFGVKARRDVSALPVSNFPFGSDIRQAAACGLTIRLLHETTTATASATHAISRRRAGTKGLWTSQAGLIGKHSLLWQGCRDFFTE